MRGIIINVFLFNLLQIPFHRSVHSGQDTARKITAEWQKTDIGQGGFLRCFQRLADFIQMLMPERLVQGNIGIPPAKMRGCRWLLPRPRGTGYAADMHRLC